MENILLGLAILGAVYGWHRTGFYMPRPVRALPVSPRVAVVLAGCFIILVTSGHGVGGLIAGRAQVSQDPVYYARRDTQPRLFWRQVALEAGMGLIVGGGLIALGRKRTQSSAAVQQRSRSGAAED